MSNIAEKTQQKKPAGFAKKINHLMLHKMYGGKLIEAYHKIAIKHPLYFNKNTLNRVKKSYICWCKIKVQAREEGGEKTAKPMYTCKSRLCIMCERYKGFKTQHKYAPSLEALYELYIKAPKDNPTLFFVTLTKPLTDAENIKQVLKTMSTCWSNILRMAKHRKLPNFIGLRKLEVTHKLKRLACKKVGCERCNEGKECRRGAEIQAKDHRSYQYHLHYHLVIRARSNAKFVISEWLKRFPEASEKAQTMYSLGAKKKDKTTGQWVKRYQNNFLADKPSTKLALIELLKYIIKPPHAPKIVLENGKKKLKKGLNIPKTPAEAIPYIHINEQFQHVKTVFTFGGLKMASDEAQTSWLEENRQYMEQSVDDQVSQKTNEQAYLVRELLSDGTYVRKCLGGSLNYLNEATMYR